MKLTELNQLSEPLLREQLSICCGSKRWQDNLIAQVPFTNEEDLFYKSSEAWHSTNEADWLEAFSHHPKIGDLENLKKKFASTQHLAGAEQSSVQEASLNVLNKLAEGNNAYENKFGFIFIVCATGKSAKEMLDLLEKRLLNTREEELKIAAAEQNKITLLRLKKLIA
jgi:2-oxo-4-hydroxy-4-carboxy-5-ureidoimidazoline decarboxylase